MIDPMLVLALIVCAGLLAREILNMRAVNREQAREIEGLRADVTSARELSAALFDELGEEQARNGELIRELRAYRDEERKRGAGRAWVN